MNAMTLALSNATSNSTIKLALACSEAQAKIEKPKAPKCEKFSRKPQYSEEEYGEFVDTQIDGWQWVCTEKGNKLFESHLKAWESWNSYRQAMKAWRAKFPLEAR